LALREHPRSQSSRIIYKGISDRRYSYKNDIKTMKLDASQPSKSAPSPAGDGGRPPASQSHDLPKGSNSPKATSTSGRDHHNGALLQQPVSNQNNPKSADSRSSFDQANTVKADGQYVIEKVRAMTPSEQRALLEQLPKGMASQLKAQLSKSNDLSNSPTSTKLYLVQAVGPNGHKVFASLKSYEVGHKLDLQQTTDVSRASGEGDAQSKSKIEQWRANPPLEASKLSDMLRQYQPLISKVTDILVQDIQRALEGKTTQPNIQASIQSGAQANNQTSWQTASPESTPTKVEQSAVHYSVKEAKSNGQGRDWLVVLLQPAKPTALNQSSGYKSTEPVQEMKVPPSSNNERQPTSDTPANKGNKLPLSADSSSRTQETSSSRTLSQLSQGQIQQLKNQWVEVANVKVLEAKDQTIWRQQLQASLQPDNKPAIKSSEQTLYQIQLKTPIGELRVISPTQYKAGELIQLQLTDQPLTQSKTENTLLQLLALRQSAQQSLNPALANALRQYQPLKSAMQMLALQHIEAGKMQALASSTRDQLTRFIIPNSQQDKSAATNPSTKSPLISNLNQAANQSKLQQLKQAAQTLLNNATTAKQNSSVSTAQKTQENISVSTNVQNNIGSAKLPNTLINANHQISPTDIRLALQQAGQELESNLKKLAELPAQTIRQDQSNKLNVQRGFGEINQNIQAGIKEWLKDLTGKTKTPQQMASSNQTNNTVNQGSVNPNTVLKGSDKVQPPLHSLKQLTDAVQNDMKSWLMQNQVQLMQFMQNDPNGRADQKQLMDGLLRVLFPKQAGFTAQSREGGESVIPKNLSVQPHLQRLFTQLLGQQSESQGQDDSQQLRQLLNLTQNLTRLQQDQVLNRNHQVQQPDSPDFQMSLPYLHDKQIQWCEMECHQHEAKPNENKSKRGWHIILRFAQDHSNAFAVEANLVGNQLVLSLWSEQQTRLQQLNQYMDLLKSKVQKAGFVCEQIQSKHGMPAKKQRQIQQGLVDVRT